MTTKKSTTSNVEKKKITCNICGKEQAPVNYYVSDREEYSSIGKAPYCKKCLQAMIIDTNIGNITIDKFKSALKILDLPFVNSLYVEVMNNENTNNANMLGRYIKQIGLKPDIKSATYADSIMFEIRDEQIKNSKVEEVKKEEVTEEMKRFWGRGLENQDYLDLQEMFDNFTRNEEGMDFKKESDYKDLCIYQLQKSKMQFDFESIPKVEKLQKMIDTLSDNLGIQAIQKQQEFDNNKFVLGLVTRYYEDIKKDYIRRWVEDLGHIDPLMDIIQTDYIGGLGAAIGVNNPLVVEAKKRMEEYSVKLEEYFDEYEEEQNSDGE